LKKVGTMRNVAIILSAGEGTRFGSQKQFSEFNGRIVWEIVFDTTRSIFNAEDVVVVGTQIPGGKSRACSVYEGLKYFEGSEIDQVVIIEAARPLLSSADLQTLLLTFGASKSFVRPLVNTIVGKDKRYYDRNDFFELLTPQCFNYNLLLEAHASAKYQDATDDTYVMLEHHGIQPIYIPTSSPLNKITYPPDIYQLMAYERELNAKKS
jgi:2-C-methyl-D-erythritol 4-phosphate cytidylyltransferase